MIRTPPATRVTVAGRACAKRMKTPYQCCSLLLRNDIFSMEWHGGLGCARLARYATHSTLGVPPDATRDSYPVAGHLIALRPPRNPAARRKIVPETLRPGPAKTSADNAVPGMLYAQRDVTDTQSVTSEAGDTQFGS